MKTTYSIDAGIKQSEPPHRPAAKGAAAAGKLPWRRRLNTAALSLPLLAIAWWFSAYPRGMIAASADCAFGHYEVQTFGVPATWSSEFCRLASERFGVKVRTVAGCVVTDDLVWYVDGYNRVSRSRIQARFGKDALAECAEDAQVAWRQAHPNE